MPEVKPGFKTTEFIQTGITQLMSLVATIFGLLVATGVVGAEFAEKFNGMANQIGGIALTAVGVLASWRGSTTYTKARTEAKKDALYTDPNKGQAAGQLGQGG